MSDGFPERRKLVPKDPSKLPERAKPFIGKEITVRDWHDHPTLRNVRVGWVMEFSADILEADLEPIS